MQRGLEGRRIAVHAREEGAAIAKALAAAGAEVELLSASATVPEANWHGARYAALVVAGCQDEGTVEPKVLQLLREFLVSDKPIAVLGEGLAALEQAGGTPDDAVLAISGTNVGAFSAPLIERLSAKLEERSVDEMSEQSFPASDPPSTSPSSAGPKAATLEGDARA